MSEAIRAAKAALDDANSTFLEELRQDSERPEGSGAQERRREENQQRMRDKIARCEQALKEAQQADAKKMQAAFEAKYQRDWNDPSGNEMKAVWTDAWTEAQR